MSDVRREEGFPCHDEHPCSQAPRKVVGQWPCSRSHAWQVVLGTRGTIIPKDPFRGRTGLIRNLQIPAPRNCRLSLSLHVDSRCDGCHFSSLDPSPTLVRQASAHQPPPSPKMKMKSPLPKLLLLSSAILAAAHASNQPAHTIRDFDPSTYNHTQGSSEYSGYPNITAFIVEFEGGSEWDTMATYKSAPLPRPLLTQPNPTPLASPSTPPSSTPPTPSYPPTARPTATSSTRAATTPTLATA